MSPPAPSHWAVLLNVRPSMVRPVAKIRFLQEGLHTINAWVCGRPGCIIPHRDCSWLQTHLFLLHTRIFRRWHRCASSSPGSAVIRVNVIHSLNTASPLIHSSHRMEYMISCSTECRALTMQRRLTSYEADCTTWLGSPGTYA